MGLSNLQIMEKTTFNQDCQNCARLVCFLDTVKQRYPDYHAKPVAPFGDANARLLIVGLAPGMHGANATGRPFTGDYAGIVLYQTLYEYGYSNRPHAQSLQDDLELTDCRITNAVKCLPPQNKPNGAEINLCNTYLAAELSLLPAQAVVLALGTVAHQAVLKALALKIKAHPFAHNAIHHLPDGRYLVDSYHSSRYNIQTKRLTQAMFNEVFNSIGSLLDKSEQTQTTIG